MNFKIYLCFILILWHQIVAEQAEEYSDAENDEIELYRQMFLRLNTIIKSNIELRSDILEVKDELKNLKEKCHSSESTMTLSSQNHVIAPPVCSFTDIGSNNIDNNFHFALDDWIIIQRRIDGSENFDRTWNEYRNGFGNTSHEFFIGLEKLYAMTLIKPHELVIVLKDFDDNLRYAKYDHFEIGDESTHYRLKVLGSYSGTAGDSLRYHKDGGFSTKDRDNDDHPDISCARKFGGGWWYRACHESNLNGHYVHSEHDRSYASGIHWKSFRAHWYSLKYAQIMVRPKK